MWELVPVPVGRKDVVESCLRENFEPFAVSTDSNSFVTIWFKRETNEIHSKQPKPKPRASRGTTKKSEG